MGDASLGFSSGGAVSAETVCGAPVVGPEVVRGAFAVDGDAAGSTSTLLVPAETTLVAFGWGEWTDACCDEEVDCVAPGILGLLGVVCGVPELVVGIESELGRIGATLGGAAGGGVLRVAHASGLKAQPVGPFPPVLESAACVPVLEGPFGGVEVTAGPRIVVFFGGRLDFVLGESGATGLLLSKTRRDAELANLCRLLCMSLRTVVGCLWKVPKAPLPMKGDTLNWASAGFVLITSDMPKSSVANAKILHVTIINCPVR